MKKLVVLLVVLAGLWLGVNYIRTGQLTLMPPSMSAEQQKVHDLEEELAGVNSQINSAGRAAGMTGMDTTQDVSALMVKKEKLEKEILEAKKKLQ